MRAVVLTRSWLGGLALAILAAAVCSGLGHWQWDRSQSPTGDLQNLVYAFNWWLFAALCLGVWVKALRLELRERAAAAEQAGSAAAADQAGQDAPAGRGDRPGGTPRRAAVPDPAQQDAEVADWNAWLAAMNAAPRR